MSEPRPFDIRISEKEEQLKKALEKVEQYKAQLKTLQTKKRNEDQRQRTHSLIVCGAEVAALYEHVLSKDEITLLVNFLREQKEAGNFDIPANQPDIPSDQNNQEKTEEKIEDIWGNNAFDF